MDFKCEICGMFGRLTAGINMNITQPVCIHRDMGKDDSYTHKLRVVKKVKHQKKREKYGGNKSVVIKYM